MAKIPVTVLQLLGREQAKSVIIEATRKLRDALEKSVTTEKLSEKAKKIKRMCSNWGPQGQRFVEFANVLLDEEIKIDAINNSLIYFSFAAVFPTLSVNNIQPGQMLFMILPKESTEGDPRNTSAIKYLKVDGTATPQVQYTKGQVRIATDKEIVNTLDTLFDSLDEEPIPE